MSKTLKTILIAAGAAVVVAAGVALAVLLPGKSAPGHENITDIDWYDANGTEFVIENVDMLYDVVTLSYHYDFAGQTLKLGADITVNSGDASDWETKAPKWSWAPIRNFAGTFDGQGHTISGLYAKTLNAPTALFYGVESSAVIRDFRLENTLFLTAGAMGSASIAVDCAGTYQRIYSNATVRCSYGAVGGLFSKQSGKILAEECWFDGEVETSHRNIGGIADQADGAEMVLSHCLNTGTIVGTWHIGADNAGGLVGMTVNSARLVIEDCFSGGSMSLANLYRSGSVVGGSDATGSATIINTYCALEMFEFPVSELLSNKVGGPVPITEKNLKGIKAYQWTNLDFENYWACREGELPALKYFVKDSAPDLTGVAKEVDYNWYSESASELIITNVQQFYAFTLLSYNTDYSSQTVKLAVDIKLNDGLAENWIETPPENRWYPVQWFGGTFDGQGHTISGVYVRGANAQGLFSRTKSTGFLKNFRLENSLIHATADSLINTGLALSGTVVGRGGGTLDSIYSNATVYGEGSQLGGIMGQVNLNGMITVINNCWFDGKVIAVGETNGYMAGGILGGHALGTLNMTHCLNTGLIHTEVNKGSMAGGFVGTIMNQSITNIGDCLNMGTLETANPYYVGGGVGMSYTGPTINVTNSFSMRECMENYIGEYASHNGNSSNVKFTGGTVPVLRRYLSGTSAYEWTNLNFDKYWSIRADGCPIPTVFYEGEPVSTSGLQKVFNYDWYDAEAGGGTIYSRADFIGFTMLSWTTSFVDKTVRLGADITINSGSASAWGSSEPYWRLIPMCIFGGTFDGQGHTISGVFQREKAGVGLFARTSKKAVIQNLRLVNSFYDVLGFGENHLGYAGSIVGQGGGTLRNIYSGATLRTRGIATAGIIGRLNLEETTNRLESLWFDGVIDAVDEEFGYVDGGIAGQALLGHNYIAHCLFTGTIHSAVSNKGAKVGGILASTENKCTVEIYDCLSAGTLDCGNPYYKGAIMGTMYTNSTVTIRNCYADSLVALGNSGQFVSAAKHSAVKDEELKGAAVPVATAKLTGINGYRWTALDFDKYWVARADACPAPKSLVSSALDTSSAKKMVDTGWYQENASVLTVDSVADLYGMQVLSYSTDFAGKTVKLGADIAFNSGNAADWGAGAPENTWISIGKFAGVLDGQGHTVSGLYLDGAANTSVAFISVLQGGTIKNLKLTNSYITGTGTEIAALAGESFGGTLEKVYTDAIVTSPKGSSLGGLIAAARGDKTTTLRECQFDGQVLCTSEVNGGQVGGLTAVVVNQNTVLKVENCLMSGTVNSAAMMAVGGVTSTTFQAGATLDVTDSLISGTVTSKGGGKTAAIAGNAEDLRVIVHNAYCVGAAFGAGGAVEGAVQEMSRALLLGGMGYQNTLLDFTVKPYWTAVEDDTPVLTAFYSGSAVDVSKLLRPDTSWYSDSEDTFVITELAQLIGFSNLSTTHDFAGKTVKLGADIDLNPDWTASAAAPAQPWGMIGRQGCMFQGTFDGQGHTVRGVYVNNDATMSTGFFSWVNGDATIKDFTLANSYFTSSFAVNGQSRVAAVVGDTHTSGAGGAISGVTVASDVTVSITQNQAGGILGGAMGAASISDCRMEGTVIGGNQTGGIVGTALNSGAVTIRNCTVTGPVTGAVGVGGILGYSNRGAGEGMVIADCTVTSAVSATQNVGGVLGEVYGSAANTIEITNCASSASVSASGAPSRGGGVVGFATNGILTVSGCSFDGSVSQTGLLAGGIVAQVGGSTAVIEDCLTTGTVASAGMSGTILGYVSSGAAEIRDSIGLNSTSASKVCSGKADAGSLTVDNAVSLPVGSGTAEAQTYVISTVEKLNLIAQLSDRSGFGGITLKLGADLDLNPGWTASADAPENPWHVMNSSIAFRGTLDGQGHTISGLYVNCPKDSGDFSRAGLIGILGVGTVRDLKIVNAYVTGDGAEIGTVAGQSFGGTLEKVYTDATVISPSAGGIGGLVGGVREANLTTLRNCQFDGTVRTEKTTNSGQVGGLVGVMVNAPSTLLVEHCLMSGTVSASTMMAVGGIAASTHTAGATISMSDTLVTGSVSSGGGGQTGAFFGNVSNMTVTIVNSYATAESCAAGTNGIGLTGSNVTNGGAVLAASELTGDKGFKNTKLNFVSYWGAVENGLPVLLAFYSGETLDVTNIVHPDTSWYSGDKDTFTLTTASQLLGFAELSKDNSFAGKTVKLGADIDLNPEWTASEVEPEVVWPMVGQQASMFQGTFDGQNHTVRGVYVRNSSSMGTGFFSWINNGATVKDFTLANSRITSTFNNSGVSRIGAVVGDTHTAGAGGIISGVTVASDVTVQAVAGQVGGILGGSMGSATVDGCRVDGTVIAQNKDCGGIVGVCMNNGTIHFTNNTFTGTVTSTETCVGGVIGRSAPVGGAQLVISGNTVSGSVTGVTQVGGVVGDMTGQSDLISGCVVSGSVTGTGSNTAVMGAIGGVVGQVRCSGLVISECSVTGTVHSAGAYELGGVVGTFLVSGTVEKTYCSATITMAQKSQNVGGILGAVREANTTVTVSQTQFDGTVAKDESQTSHGGQLGGIAGTVVLSSNTLNVTDCLMSGTVTTDKMMGTAGIVAGGSQTGAKCNVTRTLITGSVTSGGGGQTASVVGNTDLLQVTMTDVYVAVGVCSMGTNGVGQGSNATGAPTVLTAEQLQGENAKTNAPALDYTSVWITVDGAAPALRALTK